jgi:isopenicillin N synthase-like dioxygenase
MQDVRPDVGYQVGATPENTEDPKCRREPICKELVESILEENRPLESIGPDPKWRFFWRIGDQPTTTKYPALNADPVVPGAFANIWAPTMNRWGHQMHSSVLGISEMSAVGFGLPAKTFVEMARNGPHLLAPTASDLSKYGAAGTILAGFHYDLNFLTIHGKSRFPGLHIWPRNAGRKVPVKVPDGCLLVQAGKQMEYLTGGTVMAGYHEVVVTEKTVEVIEQRKREHPERPLWRISSTFFLHIASDEVLRPLEPVFGDGQGTEKYPRKDCGILVREELGLIDLVK